MHDFSNLQIRTKIRCCVSKFVNANPASRTAVAIKFLELFETNREERLKPSKRPHPKKKKKKISQTHDRYYQDQRHFLGQVYREKVAIKADVDKADIDKTDTAIPNINRGETDAENLTLMFVKSRLNRKFKIGRQAAWNKTHFTFIVFSKSNTSDNLLADSMIRNLTSFLNTTALDLTKLEKS